jgi:SAM-dependent methyltransferase
MAAPPDLTDREHWPAPLKALRRAYHFVRWNVELTVLRAGYVLLRRGWVYSKNQWNWQYGTGAWGFLEGLPNNEAVAGFIRDVCPHPRVLDVGCGSGALLEFLRPVPMRSYTGIDISMVALTEARRRAVPGARFVAADFNEWQPRGVFDAIVFNDTLYYARRPLPTIDRYARALAPHGTLIVSMFRWHIQARIWSDLEAGYSITSHATITNDRNQTWDVRVLVPKRAADVRTPSGPAT